MGNQDNYTPDGVNPKTFQRRVTPAHDFNAVLFDNLNADHIIPAGATVFSDGINVEADINKTVFVRTVLTFNMWVQFSDDSADSPLWFDYADGDGIPVAAIAITNRSLAIPIYIKATQMRIVMKNTGATAEAPYVGVI